MKFVVSGFVNEAETYYTTINWPLLERFVLIVHYCSYFSEFKLVVAIISNTNQCQTWMPHAPGFTPWTTTKKYNQVYFNFITSSFTLFTQADKKSFPIKSKVLHLQYPNLPTCRVYNKNKIRYLPTFYTCLMILSGPCNFIRILKSGFSCLFIPLTILFISQSHEFIYYLFTAHNISPQHGAVSYSKAANGNVRSKTHMVNYDESGCVF